MNTFIIAHQTVIDGDAIGNDILGMYKALKEQGYNVYIYAEYYLGGFSQYQVDRSLIARQLQDPDNVMIYHHSVYWEAGEQLLNECKSKVIFRYHNITPTRFFSNYSALHYEKTLLGIEQTKRLLNRFPGHVWLCASQFNASDLCDSGLAENLCPVVPPFHVLDHLGQLEPSYQIIDELIVNSKFNVLFTGRIAPNKGHRHLIEVIRCYVERYGADIHLWLVGSIDRDNLLAYNEELLSLIDNYGLTGNVTFTDKLSAEAIKAYYLACDAFLCMSEHEGFCVPLIEAQYLGLPIVAYGCSAIEESLGKNQIVLPEIDYPLAAAALRRIYIDKEVRKFCIENGLKNVEDRFSYDKIKSSFLTTIYGIVGVE